MRLRALISALPVALPLLGAPSCFLIPSESNSGPCVPGLSIGDRLQVNVIEEWNEQSRFKRVDVSTAHTFYGCGYRGDLPVGLT